MRQNAKPPGTSTRLRCEELYTAKHTLSQAGLCIEKLHVLDFIHGVLHCSSTCLLFVYCVFSSVKHSQLQQGHFGDEDQ